MVCPELFFQKRLLAFSLRKEQRMFIFIDMYRNISSYLSRCVPQHASLFAPWLLARQRCWQGERIPAEEPVVGAFFMISSKASQIW